MGVRVTGLLAGQHDPGDPGEFVSKGHRDEPERLFLAELPDPVRHGRGLILDVAHDCGGPDDEQPAQVSVALLGDAAKSGFAAGGMLLRCQP